MCDRRKLLLAAIVFYYEVTSGSAKLMDISPDSVSYMYNGCQKEAMEKFVHSGLLKQELNDNKEFRNAWKTNSSCSKLIPGGTKEHMAALLAYAYGPDDFTKTFDNAVDTMGVNLSTYDNHFHFKSLYFLLMDSMLLLKPKKCETLHILQDKEYTAKTGSKVRFGKFTKVQKSYSLLKKMNDLEGQIIYNITSCFFVNLGDNICGEDQDLALLSPAEVFTVAVVRKATEDESDYIEIVLNHSELNSTHNCYSLSGSPADVSTQWLVLMLVALSPFFFNS